MGRRKISIQPITDERNRKVTFVKRKAGLFKKAHELAVLCQVDLAVIILGNNNSKFYEYSSVDIDDLLVCHKDPQFSHDLKMPGDYGDYAIKSRVRSTGTTGRSHQRNIPSVDLSVDENENSSDGEEDDDDEDEEDEEVKVPEPVSKKRRTARSTRSTAPIKSTTKQDTQKMIQRPSSVEQPQPPPTQQQQHQLQPQQQPQSSQHQQQIHQIQQYQNIPNQQNHQQEAALQQQQIPQQHQQQQQYMMGPYNIPIPLHVLQRMQTQNWGQPVQQPLPPNVETVPASTHTNFPHIQSNNHHQQQHQHQQNQNQNQAAPSQSRLQNSSYEVSSFPPDTPIKTHQHPPQLPHQMSSNNSSSEVRTPLGSDSNKPVSNSPFLNSARARSLNNSIGSRPILRVEIPTEVTRPPEAASNQNNQKNHNNESAMTVSAIDTSKNDTSNSKTSSGDGQQTPQSGKSGEDSGKPAGLGILSNNSTPVSATLPSGLFSLPPPQPNPQYQQQHNNGAYRSVMNGEQTPLTGGLPSRYVPDLFPSPINFYSNEWNIPFGSGNTPYPNSAGPVHLLPNPGANNAKVNLSGGNGKLSKKLNSLSNEHTDSPLQNTRMNKDKDSSESDGTASKRIKFSDNDKK